MAIQKSDVVEYVMKSPHNTNKAVLETLLDQFAVADNKQEIELSATENKVYTPATGKVYNKVTVNVPAQNQMIIWDLTLSGNASDIELYGPFYEDGDGSIYWKETFNGNGEATIQVVGSEYCTYIGVNTDPTSYSGNVQDYTSEGGWRLTGNGSMVFSQE